MSGRVSGVSGGRRGDGGGGKFLLAYIEDCFEVDHAVWIEIIQHV